MWLCCALLTLLIALLVALYILTDGRIVYIRSWDAMRCALLRRTTGLPNLTGYFPTLVDAQNGASACGINAFRYSSGSETSDLFTNKDGTFVQELAFPNTFSERY